MQPDLLGGYPLPNCPYESSSVLNIASPSLSATYFILSLILLSFSLISSFKYNKVRIFNRIINHVSLQNFTSSYFYLILALSFITDCLRYSLDLPNRLVDIATEGEKWIVEAHVIDSWLLLFSAVLRSISLLLLTLVNNAQLRYRSDTIRESSDLLETDWYLERSVEDVQMEEVMPLLQTVKEKSRWLAIPFVSLILCLLRVFALLMTVKGGRLNDNGVVGQQPIWSIFAVIFALIQLVPLAYTTILIVKSQGPTPSAKFLFSVVPIATLIFWIEPSVTFRLIDLIMSHPHNEAFCIVPPYWWKQQYDLTVIIPIHGLASIMDLLQWIAGLGLIASFLAMKTEFERCERDWILLTVDEVRNTFDFN